MPEQLKAQEGLSKSAFGKYETNNYKNIDQFSIAALKNFMSYPLVTCWVRQKMKIAFIRFFYELHSGKRHDRGFEKAAS